MATLTGRILMNLELIDKTALISGSTKGIGFAIASQLAAEGARVLMNGRSDKAVNSALEQVRKAVPEAKVEGFAGDLGEGFVTQLGGGQSFETLEKEFFRSVRPSSLLKRFETPDEVARLVTFVCSPVASAINGAALRVDGGVVSSCF